MTAVIDQAELELPIVGNKFNVSTDCLRRLLKRHPELNRLVRGCGRTGRGCSPRRLWR